MLTFARERAFEDAAIRFGVPGAEALGARREAERVESEARWRVADLERPSPERRLSPMRDVQRVLVEALSGRVTRPALLARWPEPSTTTTPRYWSNVGP